MAHQYDNCIEISKKTKMIWVFDLRNQLYIQLWYVYNLVYNFKFMVYWI
jgi:hypothetical protein